MNARNREHADHPQPGDYWMEHFCPYFLVYHYDPIKDEVRYFDKDIREKDGWYWDVTQRKVKTRAEFEKMLHYDSPSMSHVFLCDLIPNAMGSYVKQGRELDGLDALPTPAPPSPLAHLTA